MQILEPVLILATLLCSLVAGLVFSFAVVVMPGIRELGDRDFLRAFQVIDGVIQRSQPLFMLAWVGSIVAVLASLLMGVWQLEGTARSLLLAAGSIYLLLVQLPTFAINVPLNNQLQALDLAAAGDAAVGEARRRFEPRWLLWNWIRTGCAILTSTLLLTLLLQLRARL